ncbi:hypothetical protein PMAYCL1PPCAC_00373, partial [Pristionchus mayeri]
LGSPMVATWRLAAHLVFEVPLLLLYILTIIACMGTDSSGMMETSFYTFIVFNGILDLFCYAVTIFTYRLCIYMPFVDFFGDFDEGWQTSYIYAATWLICCTREFSSLALALNRFTSICYNNKKWSGGAFIITVVLCCIAGFSPNWYMWDTNVEYQKIPMGDGSSIFFMLSDEDHRPWLKEPVWTLCWSTFTYATSMGIFILIGFHVLCGGAHPEVDRREYRLTMIAFLFQMANTGFYINQIMAYLIDRDDLIEALKAVRDGAPIIPFVHDMRTLCVPINLFLFDSVIRGRILGKFGMGGGDSSNMAQKA